MLCDVSTHHTLQHTKIESDPREKHGAGARCLGKQNDLAAELVHPKVLSAG